MKITIYTEPIPKARARTVVHNGKVRSYTPNTTREAENEIRMSILDNPFHDVYQPSPIPLSVNMLFVISKPPSVPKKRICPVTRPDIDNYTKLVMDACNGYLWSDDSQVCRLVAEKVYGTPPRIEIEVLPI